MTAEHRVRLRGRPRLRRCTDPAQSPDPRVRALVAQLHTLPAGPGPRPDFRAELRAQLVAITPRVVAEGELTGPACDRAADSAALASAAGTHRSHRPSLTGRARSSRTRTDRETPAPSDDPGDSGDSGDRPAGRRRGFARPLAVAASLVTVLALVLGGAVWLSRDAVPGDALYGLKRAAERVELSTADDDAERARDHLEFADTRVAEARELATRASAAAAGRGPLAAGISSATGRLIAEALGSADDDTRAAATLLGAQAARSGTAATLSPLRSWAGGQQSRLRQLWRLLPAHTDARTAAARSVRLVHRAAVRADTLSRRVGCHCLGNSPSDDLGPIPSSAPVTPRPGTPTTGATPRRSAGPGRSLTPGPPVGTPPTTAPTPRAPQPQRSQAPTTTAPRRPSIPLPSLSLSTLPNGNASGGTVCRVELLGLPLCRPS